MFERIALSICFLVAIPWIAPLNRTHGADHVVIVLDDSGSMNENIRGTRVRKMDAAKRALTQVISQIPEKTQVGILLLNGSKNAKHWLVPLGPLDRGQATAKVNQIRANGGTPLGDAMRIAADELLRARSKSVYGNYRLIAITDGEATDGRMLDQYMPDILARGLIIDAIGVDMATDHSLATKVHSYRRADDEAALKNAMVEILAENNTQDPNAAESDFELLRALDEVDASEILKALATPNNAEVSAFPAQVAAPAAPTPQPPVGPTSTGTSQPTTTPAPGQASVISQIIGTFCTCLLPIMIAIMIFITIASRKQRNRR